MRRCPRLAHGDRRWPLNHTSVHAAPRGPTTRQRTAPRRPSLKGDSYRLKDKDLGSPPPAKHPEIG